MTQKDGVKIVGIILRARTDQERAARSSVPLELQVFRPRAVIARGLDVELRKRSVKMVHWTNSGVALFLLLDNSEREWVHPINEERERHGEYHHLMPQLREDDSRFFAYLRMTQASFDELHNIVKD